MKQKISPLYAAIAVVAILAVAGLTYWQVERSAVRPVNDPAASGMPPQVAEELQKKLGGVQPPAGR